MGKPVQHHNDQEYRSVVIEFRAKEDSRTVEGYAAIFGSVADLGGFNETIAAGAFDGADMRDVRALFNHEPSAILARTASGTMALSIDEKGLKYSFEMPDTTLGNDLLEMMRRGDINQSSFAFTVDSVAWTSIDGQPELRTITKVSAVYDVSPVTYPAYENTEVALRSRQAVAPDKKEDPAGFSDEVITDIKFHQQLLQAAN